VLYVEQDSLVYANELQRNAPWGLARVSHRDRLKFTTFSKYEFDEKTAGAGVKVYVIDTGVNIQHVDLEGRATWGATIPSGDPDEDGNGHGSHCAGTIAGRKYGVAKKAEPVAVKVLRSNGSGTMSDVVQGVEWASISHSKAAEAAKKSGKAFKGSVANMSLGGGKSRSLDIAVNGAVDAGIVFAVAAGKCLGA
jgi:cerevisin